jgi:hypothetical protein
MIAIMRWFRRVTGADDREVRRIVQRGFSSSHMHVERVVDLCHSIEEDVVKPRLVACEMAKATFVPFDRGHYILLLVFMKESDMASFMAGGMLDVICEEATALALAAGQNPGFEIYREITTYDQAIAKAGTWDNYLSGRF